ncbi:MAG: acylphosphatase [Candidatus Methanoperedens sp.]|nr:acylphosphatase [Candidatus Methanoperedens sp.]
MKIVITGESMHDIGYRVFLLNNALNFGIDRFNAYNVEEKGTPAVFVLLESEEHIINDFYSYIKENIPAYAQVSDFRIEDFRGNVMEIDRYLHLIQVEQLNKGIPAIIEIRDNTKQMLEKQDTTIDILKKVKEDTAQIRQDTGQIRQDTAQIRQDTSKIPNIVENTSLIPAMREDTSEIKHNTREIVDKLWEKYEEMSKEITEMKITLSKIEAKVFS